MNEKEKLIEEHNELYSKLTATFTERKQFQLLNKLLESEIEIEKFCNQ